MVAWALINKYGLPLPTPLSVYFYSSQEAFEIGLSAEARLGTSAAKIMARHWPAAGNAYGIFLQEDNFARMSLQGRVRLSAHELTHVSQHGFAGRQLSRPPQWLMEGHADWIGFQVLEYLGLRSYADSKGEMLKQVRRAGSIERFPLLIALAGREWFTAANQQFGPIITYTQAFLATDWLVERYGRAAVVEYFRQFGRWSDPEVNFRLTFGISVRQFSDEFRGRLSTLVSASE